MKRLNRKTLGIILIVAVVIFAAAYQWFGPGLITTQHPTTPPEMAAQGIRVTKLTVYHYELLPLMIFGVVGCALAIIPKQFWRKNSAKL